MTMLE
jgi:hypothetical protein